MEGQAVDAESSFLLAFCERVSILIQRLCLCSVSTLVFVYFSILGNMMHIYIICTLILLKLDYIGSA